MVSRPRNTALRQHLVADEGLSLAELLVSIALLGMVLAIAWNLHAYMSRVNADNAREAYVTSEVRTPLMAVDKLLMQNSLIEGTSNENYISFLTDTNLDNIRERTVVQIDGGELRLTRWTINGSGVNSTVLVDEILSTTNANSSDAPLFTYLDSDGNPITDAGDISSHARSVITNIIVDYDGTLYSGSRETHLRNRQ